QARHSWRGLWPQRGGSHIVVTTDVSWCPDGVAAAMAWQHTQARRVTHSVSFGHFRLVIGRKLGTGKLLGIGARRGLTLRVVVASALLCLLIGGAFAALVGAIDAVRHAAVLAKRSEKVLSSANDLQRLLVDVETGQRGFVMTGDARFLQPWTA